MAASLRLTVRRVEGPAPHGASAFGSGAAVVRTTLVTLRLPSDVTCIEEAVALVVRHCVAGARPDRRLRFRLQVALSEALANAIVCGNGEDPAKVVLVEAALLPELVRITVTDEGRGFDPAGLPDPLEPSRLDSTCGRGVFLIRKLVDHLSFNERGNSLCMTLRRPPGGSISSSTA
ncbi:MAG TPA: ATP-binding protein [Gemmatimonadales bacterium]|nr:ATP-binding protein [Gemmatimonadales bacterium]